MQVVQDELFDQDEAKIEVEERRVGPAVQEPARQMIMFSTTIIIIIMTLIPMIVVLII